MVTRSGNELHSGMLGSLLRVHPLKSTSISVLLLLNAVRPARTNPQLRSLVTKKVTFWSALSLFLHGLEWEEVIVVSGNADGPSARHFLSMTPVIAGGWRRQPFSCCFSCPV